MASITWSDVEDHAPQLSTIAAAVQTDILAFVNDTLDVALLDGEDGARTKLARIYLAAHFATANSNAASGVAGPVTSETLGSMSRSYGAVYSMSTSNLGTTIYGLNYLNLINTSAARGPFLL